MSSQPSPTEISGLKKGDMVLFHRRMAVVHKPRVGGNGASFVDVTDGGGRTRTFFVFNKAPIVYFPTILEAMAATNVFPENELDRRALRAELWFTDPLPGDVFAACNGLYFLTIVERFKDRVKCKITSRSQEDQQLNLLWRTKYRSFSSIPAFQEAYEFKDGPGYELFAWSSNRTESADRIESLGPIGEVK
jgi:hypothetical protein